ncbi:MAG: protein kinase [Planctomycetota bacterium]
MTDSILLSQKYCVSTVDGAIEPMLDEEESFQLSRLFASGMTIGDRYTLESCIGQGGMGKVFLASDNRLDRKVAIKIVSSSRIRDERNFYEQMLAREARLGANLNHPGIATVHDFGFHEGRSYTVFEFVAGSNLRSVLVEEGVLNLEQARDAITDLARALDFAHGQGIVHRDLKPENICRAATGDYKILDFGIARDFVNESGDQDFAGTPAYCSPEQAAGKSVDGRTDQYSLACVFFELLSGRHLFPAETNEEYLNKHLSETPPPLSSLVNGIPPEVDSALSRALAKDPAARFDSCQEFAEALGCDQEKVFFRKLSEATQRSETNFFICHASEDSIFARQLAGHLRDAGYSSWYYQRDAIPGLSLFNQTDEAIRRCSISVILISRSAIESSDFAREIQQAHRRGIALVPVLLNMSLQEFESLSPLWRTILGPIAKIESDRNSCRPLAERICLAAQTLGVKPRHSSRMASVTDQPKITGQIWATDAFQIDISELNQVVFENELITNFLTRRNKHFVSATKGLGKTLLLTYKRLLLTREFKTKGSPVTLVPKGRPFLDFMGEMRSLSRKYESPLSELTNTKRLWNAALRISAISYCENLIGDDEQFELRPFSERIRKWLCGSPVEPTIVFKELTSLTVSEFNRLVDETESFLDQKLRQVHTPIYFFIDKVDQAIRNFGSAAWIYVQAGLIEAAWDLMNANPHIKVFASIRDEAYSNYESDIKSNLRGAVTVLRYSEEELAGMLDRLSQCYEGAGSFKDFVGMNVVTGGRQSAPEDSFQLVRRYTFGRPRDLVSIASEMSAARSSLNEKKFWNIIRETAATGLIPSIFDESSIYLDSLRDKTTRLRFLASLPCNVLELSHIKRLTALFNGMPADALDHFDDLRELYQPFRELFLAGLLGVVQDDPDSGRKFQHFKQPGDLVNELEFELPHSSFFLIHPALDVFVQKHRAAGDYQVFHQIPVGHGLPWRTYYELLCQIERSLLDVADQQYVATVHELLQKFQLAARNRSEEGMENVVTSAEWKWLNQHSTGEGREDVQMWLQELVRGDLVV